MKRTPLLPLVCLAAFAAPMAFAQQSPNMPPQGGGPDQPGQRMMHDHGERGERGMGMGILPPGMWWKSPDVIARLGLTADQQKKMEEIFRQSRLQLVDLKASLDKEQINLEPLLNATPLDQGRTLAEISRIADLRADLEKANAKMLLGLRGVLTADQWTKVHDHHREGMMRRQDGPDGERGRRGPDAQGPAGPQPLED